MGVKTILSIEDVKPFLDVHTLVATKNGIRDSVYIINDISILKIFENSSIEAVKEELRLLQFCKELSVPKVISEIFTIKGKPALLYQKCHGKSLKVPSMDEIKQIGKFLKQFHTMTYNQKSSNEPLFERDRLESLIEKSDHQPFLDILNAISIELKDDGVIHGDLFLDNANFINGSLSCVYDLSEACNGDFLFDLAVTALSWCKNSAMEKALLDGYGQTISLKHFREYVKYAGLYYSVTRFLEDRNYKELLEKIR